MIVKRVSLTPRRAPRLIMFRTAGVSRKPVSRSLLQNKGVMGALVALEKILCSTHPGVIGKKTSDPKKGDREGFLSEKINGKGVGETYLKNTSWELETNSGCKTFN